MKKLLLEEAEYIAHVLSKAMFSAFDEPMPEFQNRFPGRLESCLEQPFQTFNEEELYGTKIVDKAAVLFYLVIKNHPFENGNKRMAVTLMLIFLFKNGYWLKISPTELYEVALTVAKSLPIDKDKVIKYVTQILDDSIYKHRQIVWL